LRSGRLRPAFLVDVLRARLVSADELRCKDPELLTLRNLNTPEEYQSALTILTMAAKQLRLPRVHVELFGVPRLRAGVSRLAVEAGDIGEALRALSRACPALLGSVLTTEGSLQPAYTVNINGQHFTTDPTTPLRDGDSLILLAGDVGG